eukprot:4512124-Prymnesium_polylepis.1
MTDSPTRAPAFAAGPPDILAASSYTTAMMEENARALRALSVTQIFTTDVDIDSVQVSAPTPAEIAATEELARATQAEVALTAQ